MDTQNTPIHFRLWNRDFWLLAFANMLVTMAVYMQIVLLPRVPYIDSLSPWGSVAGLMIAYAVGLYLLGGCCSYLVQRKRRNKVCIISILLLALLLVAPHYVGQWGVAVFFPYLLLIARCLAGALFGISQMILSSTLVVDCSESFQRTEANYAEAWFGRLAIVLGPLAAILISQFCGHQWSVWVSAGLAVGAALLIMLVDFPFRAPEENTRLFSLDRFFLPTSWLLYVNLLMATTAVGICLHYALSSVVFLSWILVGFLLAVLAEKYIFVNAELKYETVLALACIALAIYLLSVSGRMQACVAFMLTGLGCGLIGSRFLLSFIKLSRHCQRGTSQSTFFLAWETGLALGLAVPWIFRLASGLSVWRSSLLMAFCIDLCALLLYLLFTHRWYMKHKNR